MKHKLMVMTGVFILVAALGTPLVHAQYNKEDKGINTSTFEEPLQGTIIPCELCVILYPKRYEKEPQTCPVCHGAKEHFEAAQMMTREMAQMRLHEIDMEIQEHLHEALIVSLEEHVDIEQLKDLRKLYMRKLIHLMVHGLLEVEPVKEKILQMDEMIEM